MKLRTFRDLSRRERLYRFRNLAGIALQAYDLTGSQLHFLQYGENVIYRVDLLDEFPPAKRNDPYIPGRYLLRLHAWNEPDYITSEMIWLDALAAQAGLPVPAPLRTREGEFSVKVSIPELQVSRHATLLRWLDGRKLNKGIRPKHLYSLGQMIARLHNFSCQWEPPEGFDRPTWDWDTQLGGSLFDANLADLLESMPDQFRLPFEILSKEAKRVMAHLGTGPDAFGLIHADLYPENVLFSKGQARPIDFEDCGYSYWMWDIGVALCTWAWRDGWEVMRDAFYNGYAKIRTLPKEQWDLLDLFIAAQYATMLIWASAFLKHDPKRSSEYIPWRDDSGQRLLRYFDQA